MYIVLQNAMDVGEPETGPSSPGGLSVGKDSSRASNEFDSGIETMEVDDGTDKLKATEKRKRTSSRYTDTYVDSAIMMGFLFTPSITFSLFSML